MMILEIAKAEEEIRSMIIHTTDLEYRYMSENKNILLADVSMCVDKSVGLLR